ncbi:MAG: hypothetical protein WAK33_21375 [Silvibacterium sp.]
MRFDAKKVFYFHTDANSLGGFIEKPFQKIVPSQASVSLPAVGGHVTRRTEAFNFEEIISCRAAYTRVSGREVEKDGPWSTLVTSVIEGLNILEVVTAERIVAQISVEYTREDGYPKISLAGSHFERLRLGGCEAFPRLNSSLLDAGRGGDASQSIVTWPVFQKTGREQASRLIDGIEGDRDTPQWVVERFGWMNSDRESGEDGCVLCSLVDGVDQAVPGRSFGHVVEIPDFGRIFLGELLVFPRSIQLSMIRAELGSSTAGAASAASGVVGGHMVPP